MNATGNQYVANLMLFYDIQYKNDRWAFSRRKGALIAVSVILVAVSVVTYHYFSQFLPEGDDESSYENVYSEYISSSQSIDTETGNIKISKVKVRKDVDLERLDMEYPYINDCSDEISREINRQIYDSLFFVNGHFLPENDGSRTEIKTRYDIRYVDEEIFEMIKSAYSEIDYSAEFESGKLEIYDEYLQRFWHLLQSDVPFWDKERNREVFMKDWEEVYGKDYTMLGLEKCRYFFFDMDGNGLPELCIIPLWTTVVFAYDSERDQYTLWVNLGENDIVGTRKVIYHPEFDSIICDFFQLNEYGDYELETLFWAKFFYGLDEDINMVMFPNYLDQEKKRVITEEMKQQGVYEESSGQWFFRITDEQFEELQKPYMEAYDLSLERRRNNVYTYEELFGKFEME